MKKLKTNKSVQKRIRVTATGKFKRMQAGKRHLLESKTSKRKRHLRKGVIASPTMVGHLRRLLPYAQS